MPTPTLPNKKNISDDVSSDATIIMADTSKKENEINSEANSDHRKAMREFDWQVRSRRPIVYICTHEESRVIESIKNICATPNRKWNVYSWDVADGVKNLLQPSETFNPNPVDQLSILEWFKQQKNDENSMFILVLKDFHKFLGVESPPGQTEHTVVRQLRNIAEECQGLKKQIVIMGTTLQIPSELEKLTAVIDWPLPEYSHIQGEVSKILTYTSKNPQLKHFKTTYSEHELDNVVRAFQGLTLEEVRQFCTYSLLTASAMEPKAISAKKRDIIRKHSVVDWVNTDATLDTVGGLTELKSWLKKRKNAFTTEAKEYGLPSNPKGLLLVGVQGGGKCHKIDTPIMMFDGHVKMVQDIEVGDYLMGADSKPREVLSLCRGRDEMFQVTPTKGESYVVNSEHILSLKVSGNRKNKHFKEQDKNNVINISVKDYLKKSDCFKQRALGYRAGVNFSPSEVPLDPYYLGVWLGDGHSNSTGITNVDPEVIDYLSELSVKHDMHVAKRGISHFITHGNTGHKEKNYLYETLKLLDLVNNKHIPHIFKCNSKQVRLQVLAGLIDSDGYLNHNGYEIVQKNKKLTEDILFLARSLGFSAYAHKCEKTYDSEKFMGVYYRITINGNVNEIPVKISRKKAQVRQQVKDVLTTGIIVKSVGEDNYYGFNIDGDHLFLMGDFTVTHNSLASTSIAQFWNLPLLRLDMGKVFSGIVGSSEANIRSVLKIAEAISPCVLWLDEIDKGMSGSASSNKTDGGTASRVMGSFLTWMQEKKAPVYVVATANDVSQLPPELLRKGRFDEIFFVDLPSLNERNEIFAIHFNKRGRDPKKFDLDKLSRLSGAYTGAEIEAAIESAMYEAFSDNQREVTTSDVVNALEESVPLSVMMKEKIAELREWAKTRARNASIPATKKDENVNADKHSLMTAVDIEQDGGPDLG